MTNEMRTNWIWMKGWTAQDEQQPALLLFRRTVALSASPERAEVSVSADSRYKLFCNGHFVEAGPSRGDLQIWFCDRIDLTPFLRKGENVLAVQVLRYPRQHDRGNHGIFRTEHPGLYLAGSITDCHGCTQAVSADRRWMCRRESGFHIVPEAEGFSPLMIYENRWGDASLQGWMLEGYDDSRWEPAQPYPFMSQAVSPGNLQPRTIPFLRRRRCRFQGVTALRQSLFDRTSWAGLLRQGRKLTIPAHTREVVELTAGEEMTGYLHLDMQGGTGAEIALLQSEGYVLPGFHKGLPRKGHREDWRNGHLQGYTDRYHVAGCGTREQPERYEPFWFRTFRFIRLEIETKGDPLTLLRLDYTETGYPLEIKTAVSPSVSGSPVPSSSTQPLW